MSDPPFFCPYCTHGPHLTRAEVSACHKRFIAWLDDPIEQAKCIYCRGPRHPELHDQLACERRWCMADAGCATEEEYEQFCADRRRQLQEARGGPG
jgi:hypothetical protein